MATSDQTILDNAKNSLNDILLGKVEEFREGSESARTLRIEALQKLIQEYEAKVNAQNGNVCKPIREVAL